MGLVGVDVDPADPAVLVVEVAHEGVVHDVDVRGGGVDPDREEAAREGVVLDVGLGGGVLDDQSLVGPGPGVLPDDGCAGGADGCQHPSDGDGHVVTEADGGPGLDGEPDAHVDGDVADDVHGPCPLGVAGDVPTDLAADQVHGGQHIGEGQDREAHGEQQDHGQGGEGRCSTHALEIPRAVFQLGPQIPIPWESSGKVGRRSSIHDETPDVANKSR